MRPASLRLFIMFAGTIGLISNAIAGPTPVSPGGTGNSTEPVISSTGGPASSNFGGQASPTNTSPASSSTYGSQSNSGSSSGGDEQQNVAGTGADGLPILKRKPGEEREKIIQLKDGQKLPTSGVDPKFQGSLLNTSIDSIASLVPRKDKDAATSTKVALKVHTTNPNAAKDGAEPQKKSEPGYARPKENPSPASKPSTTASPAAKTSSERTQ
jgi:hypothetical protein